MLNIFKTSDKSNYSTLIILPYQITKFIASAMSGYTIPRLNKQNDKSLERDIVLEYSKAKVRLQCRRELEAKRNKWSNSRKQQALHLAKIEEQKEKFKRNREKILHNAKLKAQDDLALNKKIIENQVSVIS